MSSFQREFSALIVLSVAHVTLIGLQASGFLIVPRLVVSVILLFFMPGHFLQAALFPRHNAIDSLERLGMSIGLSIATIPPLALILDYSESTDLSTVPIVTSQLAAVTVFAAASFFRRRTIPKEDRYHLDIQFPVCSWWSQQDTLDRILYAVLTLATLSALAMAALIMFSHSPAAQLTEFYIVGEEGLAENYPRFLTVGEPALLRFGVANREGLPVVYHVEIWANDLLLAETDPFRVDNDQKFESSVRFALDILNPDQQLLIQLHRDNRVYRELHLWVEVRQ
jgi:uncharacterized membrane protein